MDKKFKFTNANIKNLPTPIKRIFYYDTVELGLSVQVTPSGAKAFYLRDRVLGSQIRVKLGEPSYMSVEEARQEARIAKINMKKGINPIEERRKISNESILSKLYEQFMADKEASLKQRTITYYKDLWRNYLIELGKKKISQISVDEVKRLHRHITTNHGHRCANQTIVFLRTIYNYFIKQNTYTGHNPASAVILNRQETRTRHLDAAELKRFNEAINQIGDSISKYAILMALITGARRDNVFSMHWQDINFETKTWIIPETKTGKNISLPLADAAIEILNKLKELKYNDYVFFSTTAKSGHICEVRSVWRNILKKANITDLHLHDLRHTLATQLIAKGADAFMVKRALTHKNLQSTQIYVNLGVEELRDKLNETVNSMIGATGEKIQ